ncbi:MAG: hypothetical protein OXF02_06855 [Simkaniaceae bacterium]|nr:hypothetical protein [Simkaniaceae bacterium]
MMRSALFFCPTLFLSSFTGTDHPLPLSLPSVYFHPSRRRISVVSSFKEGEGRRPKVGLIRLLTIARELFSELFGAFRTYGRYNGGRRQLLAEQIVKDQLFEQDVETW